jgi:polyhydroxybutyrate depolymerase
MRCALVFAFLIACGGNQQADDDIVVDASPDVGTDATLPSDASPVIDAGSPSDAAGPCGTRTGQRGLTSRTITMPTAPTNRTYLVYLPASLDPQTPVPIVLVHHGYTMSGQAMHDITEYSALADQEGFAVVFPDGESGPNSLGAPWNVGDGNCASYEGAVPVATGDDFAFDVAMRADVESDQCVDEKHTFVTGFSMGGYYAHHIGCMRPDFARAIAPHSGGTHDFSTCIAGHEPVIVFHGDSDPVIPKSCDDAAVEQWIAKNGCATTADVVQVTNGSCSYYQNCPADGQVAYCTFSGMGHAWAGGAADAGIFSAPNYASATTLQWDFFKKYAW